MTRAFVAIGLPEDRAEALAAIVSDVTEGHPVAAENLHLTLVFLGDVSDLELEEVHDGLAALRADGFELTVADLGSFGRDRIRSLWAGASGGAGLGHLQRKVAQAVRRAGVDLAARRFVPHVTLVRFGGTGAPPGRVSSVIARHGSFALPGFQVRAFALYVSHLTAAGPRYEELARYPLAVV